MITRRGLTSERHTNRRASEPRAGTRFACSSAEPWSCPLHTGGAGAAEGGDELVLIHAAAPADVVVLGEVVQLVLRPLFERSSWVARAHGATVSRPPF